ncbi:MAG: nucleotide sugar dehydrogenase [Anaeromicrobium sp.]|jgi:UDP-N-acetyl-D-glucosamine dehydrogenase|uniref:nucleotide sugar dehydrogenase n=1 Tax=Anaeromicrobium sp. TaxID=1929132 RepID=UPI0025D6CCBB|nr:nucleotide sugar dehydrogenase [Anaeromicrobium sp.]MCT4595273.1 nucleotide sugar dehydrogenase [Anaeromicrobium sp.]
MLENKILNINAKIAVIGLGYVGLPLAVELANIGFKVFGIDIAEDKVESLKSGKSYVIDVKDQSIRRLINKNLFVSKDYSVISNMDVIIICVPTPLNKTKDPDITYINFVVEKIVKYMREETLIILESTTYPGTTEELIVNVIESEKNFKVGKEFFVCFSPERVDPANKNFNIKNTPKIIGGSTSTCLELGSTLYGLFIEKIIKVRSTRVAEMTKLLENIFRSVNIALVNELTHMSDRMGINIWEVIEAASTKPYGFMSFQPGPGIGGHCIPLDPMYLSWKAKTLDFYSRFIELASDINGNMPRYVMNQIIDILNDEEKSAKNSNILIIGLAYKKDIDDLRESPAIEIFKLLKDKGANVSYYDSYVSYFYNENEIIYSQELTKENLQKADLVAIITDHSSIDYQFIINNSKIVYDTRNVTKKCEGDNIILLGGMNGGLEAPDLLGGDTFD